MDIELNESTLRTIHELLGSVSIYRTAGAYSDNHPVLASIRAAYMELSRRSGIPAKDVGPGHWRPQEFDSSVPIACTENTDSLIEEMVRECEILANSLLLCIVVIEQMAHNKNTYPTSVLMERAKRSTQAMRRTTAGRKMLENTLENLENSSSD